MPLLFLAPLDLAIKEVINCRPTIKLTGFRFQQPSSQMTFLHHKFYSPLLTCKVHMRLKRKKEKPLMSFSLHISFLQAVRRVSRSLDPSSLWKSIFVFAVLSFLPYSPSPFYCIPLYPSRNLSDFSPSFFLPSFFPTLHNVREYGIFLLVMGRKEPYRHIFSLHTCCTQFILRGEGLRKSGREKGPTVIPYLGTGFFSAVQGF